MDEITDTVGALSLTAKEWRPGQGFSPAPKAKAPASSLSGTAATAAMAAARQNSAGSDESTGSARGWNNAVSGQSSSWGGEKSPSQAVDVNNVNGTHYFGNAASPSWESSRHHQHTSAAQSSLNDNTSHTNTTIPSHKYQQHVNPPRATLSNSLSLPMEEYHHYRELSLQSSQEMDPNDPRHKAVPPSFCRAYCLDNRHENDTANNNTTITPQRSSFGYPTSVFRVTSTTDGNLYCLRRIDSVRCVSHKIAQTVMHQWLSNASGQEKHTSNGGFDHPGVVRWYKCFLSQRAVFFVHQYHAGAVTLRERFFNHAQGQGVPLPESLIWSCLVQLVSAVRAVHGNNLAVRSLQLNHVLCTQENIMPVASSGPYGLPKLRLRINCIGIIDVLEFEARKGLEELQSADMRALGCILLSMTTGTEINVNDIYRNNTVQQQTQILMEYFQFVQQNYSREMYVLVHSLLNPSAPPSSIRGIAASMAMRAFDELDGAHGSIDEHSAALMGIYESGRALRLLLKLAYVNERPEFGIDKNWSESGDCYILKLFRDFGEYKWIIVCTFCAPMKTVSTTCYFS
mmetsp:Transcript_4572/g.8149  ORF Transcript_4572/g.8149 Transcript_4572/m.8149 type:complete len:570 (-) Transcript_4572:330-2039(-)